MRNEQVEESMSQQLAALRRQEEQRAVRQRLKVLKVMLTGKGTMNGGDLVDLRQSDNNEQADVQVQSEGSDSSYSEISNMEYMTEEQIEIGNINDD